MNTEDPMQDTGGRNAEQSANYKTTCYKNSRKSSVHQLRQKRENKRSVLLTPVVNLAVRLTTE